VALGEAGLDDRDLRRQILTVLGEVIAFDYFAWLLTDPVTAVGAAPLAEVPRMSELPALIKAKYATSVNRWTILLRQSPPVRLLSEATGGELARSLVWREVMSRYGVSDVASAVFADQYGCGGGTIVVTIEEASATDRLDLFGRAFGFTARERELLSLLAIGSDTRALARQMSLSEHTVQDHLKSIFAKTGSRDRITLLSRALGTRLSDADARSVVRGRPAPG
jgi:DNA-binding CsgD family transcriptional regulator